MKTGAGDDLVNHQADDLVSFRAAGWLAAPDGESRTSTIALIKDLVAEIERLRGVLEAIKNATAKGERYESPAVYNTADGALRGLVEPVESNKAALEHVK